MLYKNLTAKELFSSIYVTRDVVELFAMGLERGYDRLAGAAMEELLRRGDTDSIVKSLDYFYEKADFPFPHRHVTTLFLLMRDLSENCRKEDAILGIYAAQGVNLYGPTDWIKQNAERFKKVYRSGAVKNAKPWVREWLALDNEGEDN